MHEQSVTATLPEVIDDKPPALVVHNVSREQTHGPSQAALVRFYQVLAGIAEERRHLHDQGILIIGGTGSGAGC